MVPRLASNLWVQVIFCLSHPIRWLGICHPAQLDYIFFRFCKERMRAPGSTWRLSPVYVPICFKVRPFQADVLAEPHISWFENTFLCLFTIVSFWKVYGWIFCSLLVFLTNNIVCICVCCMHVRAHVEPCLRVGVCVCKLTLNQVHSCVWCTHVQAHVEVGTLTHVSGRGVQRLMLGCHPSSVFHSF